MLTEPISVLDAGFIRYVDHMGDEQAIVDAARISYQKGTKRVNDDIGLIRYLMRHRHTTPLEMCELKLHVRIPMDAWRQMIRHRTASVNEYSTRYSEAIDAKATTDFQAWREQSNTNKQGSAGFLSDEDGRALSTEEAAFHRAAEALYSRRLALGVAREQARKDLPLSTYTEAYWKVDLHNLLNFLALRLDAHAQLEIRLYAQAIASIVKEWVPNVWQAFEDYRLNSYTLSSMEMELLQQFMTYGHISEDARGKSRMSKREMTEFNNKFFRS